MTKTWFVGGRHYNKSINQIVYEKLNPTTKKLVEVMNSNFNICGRNNSQIFTE